MGMLLLQSATSVLRETWGFDLVPVRQLVVHCVEMLLIVIGCVGSLPDFDRSCSDMVRGRRSVNNVEITFVFDRNEGTSGSARTKWLLGIRHLGCLLRVNKLRKGLKGALHIEATVLAIRSAHEELKSRTYEIGLYQSGLIGYEVEYEELEGSEPDYDDDGKNDDSLYS
ncbi:MULTISPECIES: hypothetical protein [Pseudomonas]|nr:MULTISPECIES: hypothetical protein [Pseudomonas]MDC7813852.1 hypothetical protein [Pseudomonas sp. BLCC-B112]